MMAALLTAAGGVTRALVLTLTLGKGGPGWAFLASLGCAERCLWSAACVAPPLQPVAPHAPLLKALRCYQLMFAFPSRCCWGGVEDCTPFWRRSPTGTMLPVVCRNHPCYSPRSSVGGCKLESQAAHPYLCLTLISIHFNIL